MYFFDLAVEIAETNADEEYSVSNRIRTALCLGNVYVWPLDDIKPMLEGINILSLDIDINVKCCYFSPIRRVWQEVLVKRGDVGKAERRGDAKMAAEQLLSRLGHSFFLFVSPIEDAGHASAVSSD